MALLEWSERLPDWQRDALRRIAVSERLDDQDRAAIAARLKHAHGIPCEGDLACQPLAEGDLPARAGNADVNLIASVGPVRHVDQLAPGQELKFALDGITLIYGDNGSGKSGYARIAKQLCHARVVGELRGNVFSERIEPPPEVHYRYKLPNIVNARDGDWVGGQERPAALSRLMVFDTANANVYVDGRNEIIYLPREIEIATRLGSLMTNTAADLQREADEIGQRYRGGYGAAYSAATTSGVLISLLVTTTPLGALPTEETLRIAAQWSPEKEAELGAIKGELAQDPAVRSAVCRRVSAALNALADELTIIQDTLNDIAVEIIRAQLALTADTAQAAAISAQDQFANEPIANTGTGPWGRMYGYARAFAAEAGVRAPDEPFQVGDRCPTCQQELGEEAVARLGRFDRFVADAAAREAAEAEAALAESRGGLESLRPRSRRDIDPSLAEYRAMGAPEATIADAVAVFADAALVRRNVLIAAVDARNLPELPALPENPIPTLRAEAIRLDAESVACTAQPARDPEMLARLTELEDAKRLSQELLPVLARRTDLERRLRLLNCKVAADTRGLSQFATRRRRELITPELQNRINDEILGLDLDHIPFRLEEASDRGRNFFDVALNTTRAVTKNQVLSESEQRALGIACFLAEAGRIPGNHGLVIDDPVSSLDHNRLRKVAERLVQESGRGRQVIIFTHNLVFYQEVLAAAATSNPQVPVLKNFVSRLDGRYGLISNDDEPWIAKKVTKRIAALRERLQRVSRDANRGTEEYRQFAKSFYTDLRDTWERLVEEVLLGGVVERFNSGVKTQNLKLVTVTDDDYRMIYAAMKRVSELAHDMAAGRNIPIPDSTEIRRDLDALDQYRADVQAGRREVGGRREALEQPPPAQIA